MKTIKLRFVDFSAGYVPEEQLLYRLLSQKYVIDMSGTPDYIISCGLGFEHLNHPDAVKIQWVGENIVPDFNCFDYAIGFDDMTFGDRYLRVPLYVFYRTDMEAAAKRPRRSDDFYLNRGFCSFVVTNDAGDPLRTEFFNRLSRYKQVASGGRYLNNVGGRVADKEEFCRGYKFNIAFENSISKGYVTEKILQAYAAETLPIYYGDSGVERDFTSGSMIRVQNAEDVERAVAEIIRLDEDDQEYLDRVRMPCFNRDVDAEYVSKLNLFLQHVFDQDIRFAHRRNRYGFQPSMVNCMSRWILVRENAIARAMSCKRFVKGIFSGG